MSTFRDTDQREAVFGFKLFLLTIRITCNPIMIGVADGAAAGVQLILRFFAGAYLGAGFRAVANICFRAHSFYIWKHCVYIIPYFIDIGIAPEHIFDVIDQSFPKTIVVF